MTAGAHFGAARVRAMRDVAADVRLLEIEPAAGVKPYPTGAHLDLAIDIAGLPDVRSYSLVGDRPADGAYRIAVKRLADSRGGSEYIRSLEPGAELSISEPRSHFEIQYGRSEYLLVAGGIGVTPMIGMAHTLARHGRPFRMLYAARSRDQMAFVEELSGLLGERLELFASAEGRRLDIAAEIRRLQPEGELYLCGPLRLIDAARTAWMAEGRPVTRLRFETFASGGRVSPEPFTVRVRDYGTEIHVTRHQTMLAALRGAGIDVMWDCLRGECGLCTVDVCDGDHRLDHRDVFLSEEEQAEGRKLCTCVSRAVGGTITVDTGFRAAPPPATRSLPPPSRRG
jgi:ferredoxin-NADP reductase